MQKKKKTGKKILIAVLVTIILASVIYLLLPEDQKNELRQNFGIEESSPIISHEDEKTVVVRNVNSHKAMIGDNWIISGKIFNLHETENISRVKLMFTFSDGVETITLIENIPAKNSLGKKFKQKFSGHGDADFESVTVLEYK